MNIHGKKYLDANLYDEILVLNNKVNVTGNIKFPLKKGSESFSDDLEKMDDLDATEELIDYFLRNNNIDFVDIYYNGYSSAESASVKSKNKEIYLLNYVDKKQKNRILSKYMYDRAKKLFNNNFDEYHVTASKDSYYYEKYVNGKKICLINLKLFDNTPEYEEMKFIKELFEDKLSNEKEEAILNGGYVYSEKENKKPSYVYELVCGDIKVLTDNRSVAELLKDIIVNHNLEIKDNNVKQLKLKGF